MTRVGVAVFVALALTRCGPTSICGPSSATVQSVIDGDTVELSDGKRLRLLLVDTPETTNGKNDCYGQEAAGFTRSLVEGKAVQLAYDDASCTDRFGRTLAYVSIGGQELNTQLVTNGLACTLYVAPGGSARREEFDILESEAKTNRVGMWGACTLVPCDK